MSPPSSGLRKKLSKQQETNMEQAGGETSAFCLIHAGFLLGFFFQS
jgi:hypothetical protein